MRKSHHFSHPGLFTLFILMLLFSACRSIAGGPRYGAGACPTATGQTATATPASSASCAPRATPTAEAWVSNQQVVGSINGGPEAVLSSFTYPLGLPNESQFDNDVLTAIAWAPDARHLVVAVAVLGPYVETLYPYLVDTHTHAVTRVPLPAGVLASWQSSVHRLFAWADDHTLLIFGGFRGGSNGSEGTVAYNGSEGTVTYRYDLSQRSLTPLPGVTAAYEGVVRRSTLFYLELSPLTQVSGSITSLGSALLHRYNMTTQSEIGAPITLGATSSFWSAEGAIDDQLGWDASPDGTRIVYQQTQVSVNSNGRPATTSTFLSANADGSGATPILTGATAITGVFLAISPNGQWVAVTKALPTPTVLSSRLSGGAAHSYQPDAYGPLVWLADSSAFEAELSPGSRQGIERWRLNTGGGKAPGTIIHQNSSNPATLP